MFPEAFRWLVSGTEYIITEEKMKCLAKKCQGNIANQMLNNNICIIYLKQIFTIKYKSVMECQKSYFYI